VNLIRTLTKFNLGKPPICKLISIEWVRFNSYIPDGTNRVKRIKVRTQGSELANPFDANELANRMLSLIEWDVVPN